MQRENIIKLRYLPVHSTKTYDFKTIPNNSEMLCPNMETGKDKFPPFCDLV